MSNAGNSGRSSMAEMPAFLKTGVPLVVSLAGLICAGIITRRCMVSRIFPAETEVTSLEIHLNSHEEGEDGSKEGSESDIEENLMDDSSMVEERKRFEVLVLEGLKVVERLGFLKMENRILRRKVRKFQRKANQQSLVIREKDYEIEAAREEIRRIRAELEERANVIDRKEDESRELQAVIYDLQVKLNSAEIEARRRRTGEYKHNELVDELEQLRGEQAAGVTENIRLRWTNACIRYELVRIQIQLQQHQMDNIGDHLELGNEVEGSPSDDQVDPKLSEEEIGNRQCVPKRKQFLRKIRRWVEGGSGSKTKMELEEKLEGGRKSIGGFLQYAESGEEHLSPVRKLCATA